MGLASLTAGTQSGFLGKVVDFKTPFAIKDRILTQNDDSSESTESPFRRLMDTLEHPNRQTQRQQTNTPKQEQEDFNATKHDVGVPDTAVQLKTNTKENKASMLPPPSSIPRPYRTISEEKTLDTLDDVKEKGEYLGIGEGNYIDKMYGKGFFDNVVPDVRKLALSLRGPDDGPFEEETLEFEMNITLMNRDFEKAREPGQALAGQEWTVATSRTGGIPVSYQSGKTYQLRGPYGISLSSDERQAILDILASRNQRFMAGGDDLEDLNFLPVAIVNIIKSYCLHPATIFRLDPATGEMESVAGLANQNPQNHQDTRSLRTGNLLRHEYEPTVWIYIRTPVTRNERYGLSYQRCRNLRYYRVKRGDTIGNIGEKFLTDTSSDTRNLQLEWGRRVLDDEEIFGDVLTGRFRISRIRPVRLFAQFQEASKEAN